MLRPMIDGRLGELARLRHHFDRAEKLPWDNTRQERPGVAREYLNQDSSTDSSDSCRPTSSRDTLFRNACYRHQQGTRS